ncbi:unnamed protein product [Rotaria sordida]|uniref:G-protein coupled receptors family 1 profile domain-containing protein n=1 Tax=Rotaria sordida TaxID=392033 RepID=A0A819WXI2_9BILA|nr:unnamed protein product [Rotaria sordida]CAF4133490.1 unnamed protein product [Rotaria sordida]
MNETDSDSSQSSEPELYRHIKLYLFGSLEAPSIIISIYIIFKSITSRSFRSHINNHSIMALIVVSFLDTTSELPITLQYLRIGYVKPNLNSFCLFWIWYNFSLQSTNLFLMTWTSFQRHILIFHSNWTQTNIGKIKWNYIPLCICVIYIPTFYFSCIIIYQCENFFDYTSFLCGPICYNSITWLSTYDWVTHMLLPSLLIPFASISLLFRVLIQAKKMRRTLNWRSTRKLTLQLMFISILYLLFWTPLALVSLIRIYFIPTFINEITYYYLYYTPYLVQLLIPFVSFACLPEIWPKNNRVVHISIITQNRT